MCGSSSSFVFAIEASIEKEPSVRAPSQLPLVNPHHDRASNEMRHGEENMGLSAGPVAHRPESYGNGNRDARSRKPRAMIISAAILSAVIGLIATGAAMLDYKPTQQHVEVEITPRTP